MARSCVYMQTITARMNHCAQNAAVIVEVNGISIQVCNRTQKQSVFALLSEGYCVILLITNFKPTRSLTQTYLVYFGVTYPTFRIGITKFETNCPAITREIKKCVTQGLYTLSPGAAPVRAQPALLMQRGGIAALKANR